MISSTFPLERKKRLIDELAQKYRPNSAFLWFVAAVYRAHEGIAHFLGGGFGHAAGAERVIAAMPAIVVI